MLFNTLKRLSGGPSRLRWRKSLQIQELGQIGGENGRCRGQSGTAACFLHPKVDQHCPRGNFPAHFTTAKTQGSSIKDPRIKKSKEKNLGLGRPGSAQARPLSVPRRSRSRRKGRRTGVLIVGHVGAHKDPATPPLLESTRLRKT